MLKLLSDFTTALRREPVARRYLLASLADDIGVAVSVWAIQLVQTDLMHDQRARAALVVPALFAMLLGCTIAGPLADWARRKSIDLLPVWRYRVIFWGRVAETLALAMVVLMIATGPVTILRILPYTIISGFLKTALRPTRIAFEVDVLQNEEASEGVDERGLPRRAKTYLVPFASMTGQLRTVALILGLVLGGTIMSAAHGRAWILLGFDVLTNIVFLVILALGCGRVLLARTMNTTLAPPSLRARGGARETLGFLFAKPQRSLLALLFGAWIVEIVNEMYDGRMIVRHVLGGSADAVRISEIVWCVAGMATLAFLPRILKAARGHLGVVFLGTMLLDGIIIGAAGRIAGWQAQVAIVPFATLLAADRGLSLVSGTVVDLAQATATSAAMRGRLTALFQAFVLVSAILAEGLATALTDRYGIPRTIAYTGIAQVAGVVAMAVLGGRALLEFTVARRAIAR